MRAGTAGAAGAGGADMDASDESLARELRGRLAQAGYRTAFGDENANDSADAGNAAADDDEGFGAFFEAMAAFRAARTSGDAEATALAEERLREVVRGELSGTC